MQKQQERTKRAKGVILLLLLLSLFLYPVVADPTGGTISNVVTDYGPNVTPAARSDERSTITTMVLSAIQQDQHWKAYVGNVTGILTLDNPDNATIYSWDLTTITGQVYSSRNGSLDWGTVSCADHSLIISESTFHNMTSSNADRINSTFNWTLHRQYNVGTNIIAQNTCNSTFTYVNDTKQSPTSNSPFQEVLVKDTNNFLIYMTGINDNTYGYDNTTYDFQMILAESDIKASPTPYYFYVELR